MVTYSYKIGADFALATLDANFNLIVTFCNRGGLSTKVGSRAHRLHLQGVFQTLFPTAPDACKVLTLFVKSFIADLQQGRLQHISAQTSVDDGKVILTQCNFFSEMFKFSMRSLSPCVCPVRVVAMYALQSVGYIPASDWVRKYSKVDSEEAQALWKAAWNPKVITLTYSDRIFFDGYSRPRGRERYFVAPVAECGVDSNILTPQGIVEDTIDAPCMTPRKRRQIPYEKIFGAFCIITLNPLVVIAPLGQKTARSFAYARVIRG